MHKAGGTLDEIARTTMRIRDLENRLPHLIMEARDKDASWHLIGQALGITAQGAQQRWKDLSPTLYRHAPTR